MKRSLAVLQSHSRQASERKPPRNMAGCAGKNKRIFWKIWAGHGGRLPLNDDTYLGLARQHTSPRGRCAARLSGDSQESLAVKKFRSIRRQRDMHPATACWKTGGMYTGSLRISGGISGYLETRERTIFSSDSTGLTHRLWRDGKSMRGHTRTPPAAVILESRKNSENIPGKKRGFGYESCGTIAEALGGEVGDSYRRSWYPIDKINGKSRKGRLWKTAAAACWLSAFWGSPSQRRRCRHFYLGCLVSQISPICSTVFIPVQNLWDNESGWRLESIPMSVIQPLISCFSPSKVLWRGSDDDHMTMDLFISYSIKTLLFRKL